MRRSAGFVLLLVVCLTCLCAATWRIDRVQIGQTPVEVQSALGRGYSDMTVKGRYRFVYYDPPGHGGDYVFIFKDGRLTQFGPDGDLPDPDEMPDE